MSGHIVVVGSLNMDLVVRAPRHPEIGETILGSDFRTFPGGKGANQAVAASRLGAKVRMIGRVGSDAFGENLLYQVLHNGVDASFIQKDPDSATGVALITVNDEGENTIVVAPGANDRLTPENVLASEQAFVDAAVLLVQLETPLPAVERAIDIAKSHGAQIVLNPAPAQVLPSGLLAKVDYLIPNQTEISLLTGVDAIGVAVSFLRELGVIHLVVTLGDEGVLVSEKHREKYIPAYPVHVVDTTAAGDAFVAAFAVALTEGLDTFQSAAWGNAAGALSVTRQGAQPSLPTRSELEKFIASFQDQGDVQ
jgi:ribokinase